MKLLRRTIRRLILENLFKDNPNYLMLDALKNESSFRLISSGMGMFPRGTDAVFKWAADKDCPYKIRLMGFYKDVIFIESLEAAHENTDIYSDVCEGQGYASALLFELMSYADDFDVQLSLQASAFNQTDDDRRPDTAALTAWYKRLGFEDSPQGNGMLVYNFRS